MKKEASDTVAAVSRVIAEYTISGCINNIMSALQTPALSTAKIGDDEGRHLDFVSAQYPPEHILENNAENVKKISDLEKILSKKNNDLHTLISDNEAKQAEIDSLKIQLRSTENADGLTTTEINSLKDKINELTKENYYSTEEITKLTKQLAEQNSVSTSSPSFSFAVGDKVLGNFAGEGDWFSGTISRCGEGGMYDILYDDGDTELGVDPSRVKLNALKEDKIRLANTEKEFEDLKLKLQNTENKLLEANLKLQNLEASTHSNDLSVKVIEAELLENKTLTEKMRTKNQKDMAEKDASLASQEVTISQLRKLVSDLKGSKDELESQLSEMKSDPTLNAKIEKLQAITRGFNARARVKRTKMHRDAQKSGVLVATKHTTQGESGWYCAPDGSLYYFVLDADEWILTCGPITREAFEETVLNLKPKKVSSAGYLKVSNFDLVTQSVDQPGDLYMSTSTWKLYFAVSVDHLVTENR